MNRLSLFFIGILLGLPFAAFGQEKIDTLNSKKNTSPKVAISYGSKGWNFQTADGKYLFQFQSRFQFRYAFPYDTDPVTFDDFKEGDRHIFKINRARLKIGGHAFQPWLKYYFEYDWPSSNLLDFRLMIERLPFFKVKIGQWKIHYSRERVISSGKQQMVDRSLINRYFTLDRQQGVSLFGHIKGKGLANFNYWASVLSGTGRGAPENDDQHLMWMFRGQWHFFGREMPFTGSDLGHHSKAIGMLAIAGVTNRSPYTRFSSAGGGQLERFEEGEPGQYRVKQLLLETALMFKGLSWQQELHWKEIKDFKNGTITQMVGNYIQLGYFFYYLWPTIPKPLEMSYRYAVYRPDIDATQNLAQEHSVAINWFFKEHLNKITAEFSFFDFEANFDQDAEALRFRLQWDISF